ncbi:MAG TPA: hypothetical protein VFD07_07610 [Candidatus Krumholzibacteria bacterium]|nr:hypothetical protein [Candidatus Krumholzibacteria bacterium]
MINWISLFVQAQLLLTITGEEPRQRDYGASASPVSWQDSEPTEPKQAAKSFPSQQVLGAYREPSSVKMVQLHDDRPYGELPDQSVWLARYDSVSVVAPDSNSSIVVTLSCAFKADTGELLCAFTDASSRWVRSSEATGDIASFLGWKMYPARYEAMRSKVQDVLATFWWQFGIDPRQLGQIIVRPRFNNNELRSLIPKEPPSNVWIVEALGRSFLERHGKLLTTQVYLFRDGDLKGLFGAYRP